MLIFKKFNTSSRNNSERNIGMNCAVCGAGLKPDKRYCTNCGTPPVRLCLDCKSPSEPDDIFCGDCGARLPDSNLPVVALTKVAEPIRPAAPVARVQRNGHEN